MQQTLRFPSADRGWRQPSLFDRERIERTYPGGGFYYLKPSEFGMASNHAGIALDRAAQLFADMARNDPDGIVRLGYRRQSTFSGGIRERLERGCELAILGVNKLLRR